MTDEQLIKYFRRIGYVANETEPNINTLTALQQKHSETIPFENINPLLNIPVLLYEESLFNKIVSNSRRGILLRAEYILYEYSQGAAF